MRIFVVRGCVVRIHPLFLFIIVLFFAGGAIDFAAAFLVTLFLHEAAHFICALFLHLQITQVELTPFGGSMKIPLIDALAPAKAFLLSSAGPVCNSVLFTAAVFTVWRHAFYHNLMLAFIQCNFVMLAMNLLPVLPLDGGRMLLALLSKRLNRARVLRTLLICGRVVAVSLIISGFALSLQGACHLSLITLGCYLLYAAAIEERTSVSRYLAAFMSRRCRLERHRPLNTQTLCAASSMPVFMLIEYLHPGAYHLINVLHEGSLSPVGQITEDQLLPALLDKSQSTLGEILNQNI